MVKPAAALLACSVVALSACSPHQTASTVPGKTPPVWTGSSAPATATGEQPPGTVKLVAHLAAANGSPVADATIEFANGYATITVTTIGTGLLSPGFHGMHIHAVGKCEPNSMAPNGGPLGDFNSAGGHFQVQGHTTHPASGDLTSLEVRRDGAAKLVTTSNEFSAADLLGGDKTALIIHAEPDNFAHIPPEKYTQVNGTPGPDEATLATGDAGKRVACGVIGTG